MTRGGIVRNTMEEHLGRGKSIRSTWQEEGKGISRGGIVRNTLEEHLGRRKSIRSTYARGKGFRYDDIHQKHS